MSVTCPAQNLLASTSSLTSPNFLLLSMIIMGDMKEMDVFVLVFGCFKDTFYLANWKLLLAHQELFQ